MEWTSQLDYDEDTQRRALARLEGLANAGDDQPFFMCVSFTHPHQPFIITPEYWNRYEGVEIDMPAAPAEPFDTMHPYNKWIQIHHEVDKYPPTPEQILASRRAYYGMVSYVDDKVGQLLAALDRLRLRDDTMVMFVTDHGDQTGRARHVVQADVL